MNISVIAFGQIAEIFGSRSLEIHEVTNTDELRNKIEKSFPKLKDLNYLIAIDRNIINEDTVIPEHSEIALLPPFSGG
jgi:molybdopterin converting factor small subunit